MVQGKKSPETSRSANASSSPHHPFQLHPEKHSDIMSGHNATGRRKLDKNTMRTSQRMHGNFLDANFHQSTELNWQHQFSKTPPCHDFYPFPQEINLLFPVLSSFSPSSFLFFFFFPRTLHFLLIYQLE